jgi:outer membrane protein assembly factor BamB
MRSLVRCSVAAYLVVCFAQLAHAQDNWPQLRGAQAMGYTPDASAASNLPDHWSTTENVAWKTDVAGRGWSSPVVWGDKIFLTTAVNLGETEAPKKGLYFGGERKEPPKTEHQWKVLCLDLKTGQKLWEQQAHQGIPATTIHIKNSYASETPVTDGQRVVAYFGNIGVYCYDLNGKQLWSKEIAPKKTRYGWGPASSPVLYQDRVYIVNDNDEESYLLCLNAADGSEVFRVAREEKSNWSTPFVWKNSQRTELITTGTGKNRSYDLEGRLLWELAGMSSITIALPYAKDDVLYLSSGYVMDTLRPIYAIRPGATGDITLDKDQTKNDFVLWANNTAGPYNPSSLLYGDLLYVLYDRGFFACYDPKTGEDVYEKQRIPEGKAFTSSPWAYGDKIFCLNEDGVTFVIRAGREFEILHTNKLAEDDMGMATPAIVGDRVLLRTAARLYCLKQGAKLAE